MRIGIVNDHVAYDMKLEIAEHLRARGHEVVDLGAHSSERTDYPLWGRTIGEAVVRGDVDRGIAICGTGVGISIAANKVKGIRCACVSEPYSALLSRLHNDANVLAFGARVIGIELAKMIVDVWVDGEFEAGRHAERVRLIHDIEDAASR